MEAIVLPSNDFGFGFNKHQRLLTPANYQEVFKQTSFKIHQTHLMLFIKVTKTSEVNRLGLAITKKKIKRANERNRIKRLAREQFRLHQNTFVQPVDIVLTIKQSTKDLSNAQISQQIVQAFAQMQTKLLKQVNQSMDITVLYG